jgi:hypothetical protein
MPQSNVPGARSHRSLMIGAIVMIAIASCAWIYRFTQTSTANPDHAKEVVLDLRFTAPIGYEFCAGKSAVKGDDIPPQRLPHKNLALTLRLPKGISDLPADAGAKEIVFRPGKHDVDVYKHLDSGRSIHTHGTIHMEGNQPVLNTTLNMADWPPGRYVVGIGGDPSFGYCTINFVD